jgi:hypothetical protein
MQGHENGKKAEGTRHQRRQLYSFPRGKRERESQYKEGVEEELEFPFPSKKEGAQI